MFQKLITSMVFALIMIFMIGCGGSDASHTLTIQVRDKVTGEPVPFANINVYSTSSTGQSPPRGAITATNTNGVAVVPVTDGYPTYFEVYAVDHFMRPLHYEDAVDSGYRYGWRDCGNSRIDGRVIQMRIVSNDEALALQQLPERTMPEHMKPAVLVVEPTPIDPDAQTDLDKMPQPQDETVQPETDTQPDPETQPDFVEDENAPRNDNTADTSAVPDSTGRGGLPDNMNKPKKNDGTVFESDADPSEGGSNSNQPQNDDVEFTN